MKTAEEWFKIGNESKLPSGENEEKNAICDLVEAIQLDSYRAGMLKAASLKANWHIT